MQIAGIHHSALTVSDLERSVRFYARLGFELDARAEVLPDDAERGTGVAGVRLRIAMLVVPGGRLELIQYVGGAGVPPAPGRDGIGAAHVCLQVEDVDAAVEELRREGIEFVSDPLDHESGVRWVYLEDPDGITIELLEVRS